jgi:hypothetical protein
VIYSIGIIPEKIKIANRIHNKIDKFSEPVAGSLLLRAIWANVVGAQTQKACGCVRAE